MARITLTEIYRVQDHIQQCIMDTIPQLMKENKDIEYDFSIDPGIFLMSETILGIQLSDDKVLFRIKDYPEEFKNWNYNHFGYKTLVLLLAAVETCTLRKNRKYFKEIGVIKNN